MLTVLVIVAIIGCVLLIGVVLIQNPKGGGLSSSFGGMSNQVMGVQRTTDFLEKSTWTLMGVVGVICVFSIFFLGSPDPTKADKPKSQFEGTDLKTPMPTAPAPQQPTGSNPTPNGGLQQTAPANGQTAQPQTTTTPQ